MSLPIYLDYQATTPVDPRVVQSMLPYLETEFGNPASRTHVYGWRAEAAVELARETISRGIGARPDEITFTSGATESNNLAILGVARHALTQGPCHILTLSTEHPSVLDAFSALEREGCRVTRLGVADTGLVNLNSLERAIGEDTVLVSIMAANNEIGTLQPINEIGKICGERKVIFHCDASQAVGKIPVDMSVLPIDLLSISGHKLYGPKGVGVLFVRRTKPRITLAPLFYGGGHEAGVRPGTLATHLIVGLSKAIEISLEDMDVEGKRLLELRGELLRLLKENLGGVRVNGDLTRRLPGNLHVSFDNCDADALVSDLHQIAISTGSACSSASRSPSHVLTALGFKDERVRSGIRFGLGRGTTRLEIEKAASAIIDAVERQREKSV